MDARLLRMIQACVTKIDRQPDLLSIAQANLARVQNPHAAEQWRRLLALPWPELRRRLLEESEAGADLRQNAPFGGILTPAERADFYAPRFS